MATTGISLFQLLSAPQITRVISQIKTPQSRLQFALGMQLGGPNIEQIGGHFSGYDIFNKTRLMAKGRPPGTGPATTQPQAIGHVPVTLARFHEKIPLLEERIFRTRPLGSNFGMVDIRGQQYVTRQEKHLAQLYANAREFMCSRMLMGGFDLIAQGDDWYPVDSVGTTPTSTGGTFTINYQIPAGNTGTLDPLNTGTPIIGANLWSNSATDVIGQYMQMNAAQEQLTGRPITDTWVNSGTLQYLFKNAGLINAAGTANTVWLSYERTQYVGPDGVQDTGLEVVFKGIPWMKFHSYDAVLQLYNGQTTKVIPDNRAIIIPAVDFDWCAYQAGSEIVAENVMDQGSEHFDFHAWTTRVIDPAGWELKGVMNGLPCLYVPGAVFFPTVG